MQHNGPAVVDDMNVFVQVTHQYSIMLVQRLCVRCNSAVTNWKKIPPLTGGTCTYVRCPAVAVPLDASP